MLNKEAPKIDIQSSPQFKQWISLFEQNKFPNFTSSYLKLNIYIFSTEDIKNFAKITSSNNFSIFIFFYNESFPFNNIINKINNASFYFVPTSYNKTDKEKMLKSITAEILSPWIVINPFSIESILDPTNQSSLNIHLNQLAKKIANSLETIFILEEEKSSFGLGQLLFLLLKKIYIPNLEFIKFNPENPNIPLLVNSKCFIQFQYNQFLKFYQKNPPLKNSIIHIYNASQNDFLKKNIICSSRIIFLPHFHEFQLGMEIMLDFLASFICKHNIILSQKALLAINKKSYSFTVYDLEILLQKISLANCNIITENLMMSFMEGGKKILNQNFPHYFSQVLISNAPKWKNGNIYNAGKTLLEKILINNALEICQNHKKNAAKILGINRNTLRVKKHNI